MIDDNLAFVRTKPTAGSSGRLFDVGRQSSWQVEVCEHAVVEAGHDGDSVAGLREHQ